MTSAITSLLQVAAVLNKHKTLILSGAGISTESGIPDYRGPQSSQKPHKPMRYQQFLASPEARQRYWARSLQGWKLIADAEPNQGHKVLADLERLGKLQAVLTQNVDGLHQKAGSKQVLELHGRLSQVICLNCGWLEPRERLQRRLLYLNPFFDTETYIPTPDGDADLPDEWVEGFQLASCLRCGGVLKPDVVFFGENVPQARVEQAWQLYESSEALLILGSSLTVFSGYRFAARAAKDKKPLIIFNKGSTRADALASFKLEKPLGELLLELRALLD